MKLIARCIITLLLLLFVAILPAQTIVLVNRGSEQQLNTLERLKLNIVLEMNDFLLFDVVSTDVLRKNNIEYQVLTTDYIEQPLVVVSSDKGTPLRQTAYIGDVVLDRENLHLERLASKHTDISRSDNIKYIPLRIFDRVFTNIRKNLPQQMQLFDDRSITDIMNSVEPDSIAFFIQTLQNFGTRFCMHPNRFTVAQWIADQFTRWGYTDVALSNFYESTYGFYQNNVVAIETGSEYPDQYVVLGAHYDSINQDGPIYETSMNYAPGADDNASGTAALLEIARVLKLNNYQPKYSIRFVAFAMEELGLYGSYYDVENILTQGIDVVTMINCDMIGYNPYPTYYFTVNNYPNADQLTNLALQLGESLNLQMTTDTSMIQRSDSWAYHQAGIPAVFFSETIFTPNYHTSQDILANIHVPYITQTIKLVANLLVDVTSMPEPPTDFMLYDAGNGSSLVATWQGLLQPDVEYFLTIKNTETQSVTSYATTNNNYTFTGLTANTLYQVTLSAVVGEYMSFVLTRSETTLVSPRQVTGVSIYPQYREILLNWSPNAELDIHSYKVFRRENDSGIFTEIASVPVATFTDATTQDLLWYEYKVTAVDNDGNSSPDSQIARTRHVSFSEGLLIIDLTQHSTTNPLSPPKDMVDNFYRELVSGYPITEQLALDVNIIKIENIGLYSTLIIHKNSFNLVNNGLLTALLKNYIDIGGNVIYTATDPLNFSGNINPGNPVEYPWEYSAGDLPFDYFGINTINYNTTARFARAASTGWEQLGDLEIDEAKVAAGQYGATLNRLEVYTGDFQNMLYTYQSDSSDAANSAFDNTPMAIYTQRGNSHIVLTSIPLYFIKQEQAKAFMQTMLGQFCEELSDYDNTTPPVFDMKITNYPNPFNPTTTIAFEMAREGQVTIDVFNIKGQKVKTLVNGVFKVGRQDVVWNGDDANGRSVSSGVYFYRLDSGNYTLTKKMLLMK